MGTVIDRIELAEGRWRTKHSALRLAVRAAQDCLHHAGRASHDVDLLINAGIYRDRNLGEPALAAMIQEDIGANPEDPHAGSHGTFSFDVVNGTCGVLTALQVVDGFMRSHAIDCALVVASDANPGHGMSERFPFSPAGAALLCAYTKDNRGLGPTYWSNLPDERDCFSATVGLVDHRNILRFEISDDADDRFAEAAARAAEKCLRASSSTIDAVDTVVAAPGGDEFRAALAARLGVPVEKVVIAEDQRLHTVSLAAALADASDQAGPGAQLLIVAAAAGITAGAALYRM